MRLWKGNRVAAEYEMPEPDIAAGFLASRWAGQPWPLDRALRAYLTVGPAEGGMGSAWDEYDPAYVQVFDGVLALRRAT